MGVPVPGLPRMLTTMGTDTTSRPAFPPDIQRAVDEWGLSGSLRRRSTIRRYVEDDGIVVGRRPSGAPRSLQVDPLPVVLDAVEWSALEAGLAQRAHLLELLLADVYGPRHLLERGTIPAELVLGHPGFVPQADGIPTRDELVLTATDLGRASDGRWTVLGDRTEAPTGAGYAMAVRRVTARALTATHRSADLRRLRGFFDSLRGRLLALASGTSEVSRVVLLGEGGDGESAFDDAFTAMLLGFPLARADDLVLADGRLWLRTTAGREPLDIVVRRVDARASDPLDLDSRSSNGVPGLVEASRRGMVTVVNPLGSGILENPALGAFWSGISRDLLDSDPLIEAPQTWWCGDRASLSHVLAHLPELMLSPLGPTRERPRLRGSELSASQRDVLSRRIEAEPWAWSGQEVVPAWLTPIVTSRGLVERPTVVRTFTLGGAGSPVVMPGGLARAASDDQRAGVGTLEQSIAKDLWVLGSAGVKEAVEEFASIRVASPSSPSTPDEASEPRPRGLAIALSNRSAEDLYWFGRYAERAEATARLLLVADDLVEDHLNRPGTAGHEAMTVVLDAIDTLTAVRRERLLSTSDNGQPDAVREPLSHLRRLVFDAARRGTIHHAVSRAGQAAGEVRDLLSSDTWMVLSRLERHLTDPPPDEERLQPVLLSVVESLLALAGMSAEGLVRDASWAFFDAGRRMERSQETLRLLRAMLGQARRPRVDAFALEATLRTTDSIISHRRRLVDGRGRRHELEIALDLLLVDPTNPRSVLYQLTRLQSDLAYVPESSLGDATASLVTLTRSLDPRQLALGERARLVEALTAVEKRLRALSQLLDSTHFTHQVRSRVVVEGL